MKNFIASLLLFTNIALASNIPHDVAVLDVKLDPKEEYDLDHGKLTADEIVAHKSPSDIIYVPRPTAKTVK